MDDLSIANGFANYFFNIGNESPVLNNNKCADAFMSRLSTYSSKLDLCDHEINVEVIDAVISRLKKGKAAGIDRLTAEHIQFCHPLVVTILSMLFNLMIHFQYIPDNFGSGIIVPFPKDSKCQLNKFSDFRGITISPLISKIFELCIIENNKELFATSDMQFGFKPGIGCNHAIYSACSIINYHSINSSTVNLCSLDISKAFDKVNHIALFTKLMNRNFPRFLILLLVNWYSKINSAIK